MDPAVAQGLWRTSFGPVKIEPDPKGGPQAVQGAWTYKRGGQEVVGVFWGRLNGNVLHFTWQEPAVPRYLEGAGYLVFNLDGRRFDGKWWTTNRDRSGDWNGWRHQPGDGNWQPPAAGGHSGGELGGDPYGGDTYGAPYGGDTYGSPYGETAPGPPPPPPRGETRRDYL
jgi:hypothetical protein